jgi:Zn-dependent M28 family amino/carboxypeptidase
LHAGESSVPRRASDESEVVQAVDESVETLAEAVELDPAIVGVVGRLTSERAGTLLREIAIPRHHRSAPKGLRVVAHRIADTLGATYAVSRRALTFQGATAEIVIGERRGTDPSRVVLVMAHYDAVAGTDGADDDASGVVGMLLAAEALAPLRTEATLRFVAFPFEEQGMIGSSAYVASLREDEREAIVGAFNLEMIGYTDHAPGSQRYPRGIDGLVADRKLPTTGDFVGAVACPSDAEPLRALGSARRYVPRLRTELIGLPRPFTLLAPDLLRSDHGPFWFAEIPAVMISDTADFRTPHYHQPSDVVATLDPLFLVRTAQWVAAAVGILAVPAPTSGATQ